MRRGHCRSFCRGTSLQIGVRARKAPTPLTRNPQGLTRNVTARTQGQVTAGDSRRDAAGVLLFWLLSTQGLDFYRSGQATARQGCVAGACGHVTLENWGLRGAGLLVLRLDVRRIVLYPRLFPNVKFHKYRNRVRFD